MTAVERTAYPRFKQTLTESELVEFYKPSPPEIAFAQEAASGQRQQLSLLILLKSFQKLGYLPRLRKVPRQIVSYIAGEMQRPVPATRQDVPRASRSRYRQAIRDYLQIRRYGNGGMEVVKERVREAATTMSDPADLINVAIEQLVLHKYELPAFSTLDRLVNHIRHEAHQALYQQVTASLITEQKLVLDGLLERPVHATRYSFTRLKSLPKRASLLEVRRWEIHLEWLEGILDPQPFICSLASTKVEQFAAEAYQLEAGDMLDVFDERRRHTLLLCLLHHMQVRTRDQLTTMLLKRMRLLHNNARKRLREIHDQHRELSETMVNAFADIVVRAEETKKVASVEDGEHNALLGQEVRHVLQANGGTEKLRDQCAMLQAYHNNNYLPLILPAYGRRRAMLFRLTEKLQIRPATRNRSLLQALAFIHQHRHRRVPYLPADISLRFASGRWRSLVREKVEGVVMYHRHHLEICVFTHVAEGLRSGDLYVEGSETYADYRKQMLAWADCEPILDSYCAAVQLPTTASTFVETLRQRLVETARRVDEEQSADSDLYFDRDGNPHLRRLSGQNTPEDAEALADNVRGRMPERHLLDILHNAHYWTPFTRHFGPPSGADPKLPDPLSRYLITIFGYGCNLGPAQTARHARRLASARVIGRLNAQHITTDKLDAAIGDLIDEYARFRLPFLWGSGSKAIADGTHYRLYENNLLGERHIRYGGYGGIAYHHISDTYVALFSHFIACGVWEAVYILDGLLQNKSVLQPDTVHGDTHGQSEVVFGLAHLLGIKLMPRMRNWNKVAMYRPDSETRFQNIDTWFTRIVDWALIEEHWQELMQVVLSIHRGKVLPSWLLQKLTTNSPKNRLYLAFRELGRVVRTIFLLEYVSNTPLRREIRAATTKIEAYNWFSDWIFFGGDSTIKSRDPVEQEKRIKYKDLIANAIMLQNVVDMTDVLHDMAREGYPVSAEAVATLSPYLREHIKRFGEYIIDTELLPPPLEPDKPFLSPDVGQAIPAMSM